MSEFFERQLSKRKINPFVLIAFLSLTILGVLWECVCGHSRPEDTL